GEEGIGVGGRTTACKGMGSAQHREIPVGLRQPDYGEPGSMAPGSGTPQRINRAGAAMVAILVALCRRVQGVAKTDRPRISLRVSRSPNSACAGRKDRCSLSSEPKRAIRL